MTYSDNHYVVLHAGDRIDERAQIGTWNCFASAERAQEVADLMAHDGVTAIVETCDGECYGHEDAARSDCPHA